VGGFDVRMLMPHTYMNRSGEAVAPFARYFRIEPGEILVAHDEVAFPPGVVRLKVGGGTNGHNGLRSIISTLGSPAFARLRIGVGHPGDPERMLGYLTTAAMPRAEQVQIDAACRLQDDLLKTLIRAEWQAAMNRLHRPRQPEG